MTGTDLPTPDSANFRFGSFSPALADKAAEIGGQFAELRGYVHRKMDGLLAAAAELFAAMADEKEAFAQWCKAEGLARHVRRPESALVKLLFGDLPDATVSRWSDVVARGAEFLHSTGGCASDLLQEFRTRGGFTKLPAKPSDAIETIIREPMPPYYKGTEESGVEHYTPLRIFQALDCEFDLDPASPGPDRCWVPAKQHFTHGGLERDWGQSYVFLNPPFGRNDLALWVEKFIEHANGIILVPDRTFTMWWQNLASDCDAILFLRDRIKFRSPAGEPEMAFPIGNHLIAIGERGVRALLNGHRAGLGVLRVFRD